MSDSEQMRYGMLGDDARSDDAKLEKYTGEVSWEYLKHHFESGALLYVDPSLDLAKVGQALTTDDSESVLGWKKSGDLVVPSEPHAAYWKESGLKFKALVVSPFVLIQPLGST